MGVANKRDTSAQRRARENRARRQALEARTKGAPPARPSRVAPATAEKLKRSAASTSTSTGSSGSGPANGSGGKPRRERPPRPGDRPVDLDTLEGSWFSKVMKVPGGIQVLFAAVMAVVATGLMSFTAVFVAEADIDDRDATATQTVFEAKSLPVALALVGIPLVITAVALASTLRPQRRRVWLVSAIILGALSLALLQLYLIVAGFLAYGVFRAARVEGPNEPLLGSLFGRRRPSVDPGAGTAGDAADLAGDEHGDDDASPAPTEPVGGPVTEAPPVGAGPEDATDGDGPVRPLRRFRSR